MSHPEESFNDAELTILAMEIAKDFQELSVKANIDPDDSFVAKFNHEYDIIQPSRSTSYSEEQRAPYIPMYDEYDKLTIVSLSANDSLQSIPSIPQKLAVDPINMHQTKHHPTNRKWFQSIKTTSYSPISSISMVPSSIPSTRNPSNNAYSTSKYTHLTSPNISSIPSIDVSRCLSPRKSITKRNSVYKKRQSVCTTKTCTKSKKRCKSRNGNKNRYRSDDLTKTKKFYHMRATKSMFSTNKQRKRSQRVKTKNKRKYKSDALYGIKDAYLMNDGQPAPYFVKRGRTAPIALDELAPFSVTSSRSTNSTPYLYKTKNIRFLYNNSDDGEKQFKKKKRKKEGLKQSESMFLMPRRNDEYMVELEDGFVFIDDAGSAL